MEDRRTEILKARARRLAESPRREDSPTEVREVLRFTLGTNAFCLETLFVTATHLPQSVTPIPGTPGHIAGVVNLRGEIVAVTDLARFLGLTPDETESSALVQVGDGHLETLLAVDAILDMRRLDTALIRTAPDHLGKRLSELLDGMAPDGTLILSAKRLLASKDLIVDASAAG